MVDLGPKLARCRGVKALTVLLFVACTPTAATPPDAATTRADAPAADAGGSAGSAASIPYMIGIKADGTLDAATTMKSWLGRSIDIVGATITTTSFMFTDPTHPYAGTPMPALDISFPLLSCWDSGDAGGYDDLGTAASGGYDAQYKAMADYLVSLQNPTALVAIGWEMTGNWYCWSVGSTGGQNVSAANYTAAFKHAAQIIRQEFAAAGKPVPLIEFCFAWEQSDPTSYWPGKFDATGNPGGADTISADVYQALATQYSNNGSTTSWAMIQSNTGLASPVQYDLDWLVTFAQQQDVLIGLREYGAGESDSGGAGSRGPTCTPMAPGLDDPTFYTTASKWLDGLGARAAYNIVADDAPADDFLTPGCNAAEQASWTNRYAGTTFGGTWW
jgi:hypothetical protein